MKKLLLIVLIFVSYSSKAQLYFPPISGNAWDTISPTSLGWCLDKIDTLSNYLEANNTKAFLVLKDGKIVIEKYYGTFTVDSLWYWASAGKSLTSFLVGIAKQEGSVVLTDSTSHYLGSGWTVCPPQKEGLITVLDQLRMTTGLDDGVADNYCTDDTCLQYLADAGSRWAYHTAPYTLLDGVIANGTGQSLNLFLLNKLKTPTGMTGNFYPAGYLNLFVSTARSMARFGLLVLNHGNWNGNQIMTDSIYFNEMVNTSQGLNLSYGYLWWLNGKASFKVPGLQLTFPGPLMPHAPMDMIAALGKNGQYINIVPSENLVLLRMGNSPGGGEVPFTFNDSIWAKFNDVRCNLNEINSIETNSFSVYPNPAKQFITIQSKENNRFEIYDMTGNSLKEGFLNSGISTIDLSNFISGVYIIQVGLERKKFVVE